MAASANETTTNLYMLYYEQETNELRFRAGAMPNNKAFDNSQADDTQTGVITRRYTKLFNQNTNMSFGDFYDDANSNDTAADYVTNYEHVSVLASTSTSTNYNPETRYSIAVVPGVTVGN